MKRAFPLLVLSAVGLLSAASAPSRGVNRPAGPMQPLDSARDELRVGRAWHAARILWSLGLDRGDPERTLLLADAEAGWGNWPAVREVLDGATWLDGQGGGEGWFLLGRAREDAEMWPGAADAYRAFLGIAGADRPERAVALARLARVSGRAGRLDEALSALGAIPQDREVVRGWMAAELAGHAAEAGDTTAVASLLSRARAEGTRTVTWALPARARLAAGDTAGAEREFRAVAASTSGARRAAARVEIASILLARADSSAAAELLLAALDDAPPGGAGPAAAGLIRIGHTDLALTLRLAGIADRAGDGSAALRAYDRAKKLAESQGDALSGADRLARARLMGTVSARQADAVEEFRAIRSSEPDERLGARNLELWAALRARQGRTADVTTLRGWLLEEYPGSPEAAEVLWERGSAAQTRGDVTSALHDYGTLVRDVPTLARAGEARMRTAQIELGRGRPEAAVALYEAYLDDFPEGRRWEEASFWAARTRFQLGDTAAARELVSRIRREEPVSYYSVLGARLVGEPFELDVPPGPDPVEVPWLTDGLARLDALVESGLDAGADAEESALVERAGDSIPVQLALAEALNARGRTLTGINLGWAIRGEGQPWSARLLRVVYPFPYRELVVREAAEWGVDPFMLAALIRQESAFKADIKSGAGAVGLMQVMPPTGRELARSYGPEGFREASLTTPEVNLHLGAAFYVDMKRRYDGDLNLVLSAYNAGPTRATRWKRYPEVGDAERFTERIPFDETRGYVKNVRRNLGLYQVLYGDRE